jgi:hypothetical protein
MFVRRSLYVRSLTGVLYVIVRGRQEGLSCIPDVLYPWEALEGCSEIRFLTSLNILRKDWGNTSSDKRTQDRVTGKTLSRLE